MEYANDESIDEGAMPLSDMHHSVIAVLEQLTPSTMQAVFFEAIERGPESLLKPIEDEFKKRGLDAYGVYPESIHGI